MLLEYLLMLRLDLRKGHSSVKLRLMAVRHYHLAVGAPDPLANCCKNVSELPWGRFGTDGLRYSDNRRLFTVASERGRNIS